jgi:hypothetical protein
VLSELTSGAALDTTGLDEAQGTADGGGGIITHTELKPVLPVDSGSSSSSGGGDGGASGGGGGVDSTNGTKSTVVTADKRVVDPGIQGSEEQEIDEEKVAAVLRLPVVTRYYVVVWVAALSLGAFQPMLSIWCVFLCDSGFVPDASMTTMSCLPLRMVWDRFVSISCESVEWCVCDVRA